MRYLIVILALVALIQGCVAQQRSAFSLGDFLDAKMLPYDSPPQVIYRIDDYRFVTLERYRDCNYGQVYYNDTRAGIKTGLGRASIENYRGRLINADPTGRNLAFPSGAPPHLGTSDHGVDVGLLYSTDGGMTFAAMAYMKHSFDPFEDSKKYTVVVTSDSAFISKRISDTVNAFDIDRYPLIPGFVYGTGPLPSGKSIEFDAKIPGNLRTPSGQDRITCDASIQPTNPDAPLAPQ